jgi:transcription initiation factor TFIID TATA-box-binding protein
MAFIATHVRNAEYNPQRFSAVIIRLREPKSTALFFHTGKLVVTGTKNEEDGRMASRLVGKIIHKLGFK